MANIGERSALRVTQESPHGLYLDGEELGEILLPRRYVPAGTVPGDYLLVFVYRDSEDRLVATTEIPHAGVGEFACLKIVSVDAQLGAFLDWGLAKDLLLPLREQKHRLYREEAGQEVVVYIYLDAKSHRIVATTRLDPHLNHTPPPYEKGQAVELLVAEQSELGFKAIIENAHWGLLYRNEVPPTLAIGQKLTGYIKMVRPDGKIDLSLDASGYGRIRPLRDQILEALKTSGGSLPLGDHSTPEEIRSAFNTSKKAYKQALGALFRERLIQMEKDGIRLVEASKKPK
ncbi:MAG: S1-like domain-containing RNA-binding protein [Chthoniobacteraceae bacterium]